MATKIQINSLEALERLIGNDNELEIQLRTAVVQEFATKHLKAIANETIVKNASNSIREEIKSEMFDIVNKSTYNEKLTLKEKYLSQLQSTISTLVKDIINEYVSEKLNIDEINNTIKKRLEFASESILDDLAPQVLDRKLDRFVEKRIKEKLGL